MPQSPESSPEQEPENLNNLREDFCGMFDKSKRAEALELFRKIAEEYQSENRHYHNIEHIENMLAFLAPYEENIKDKTSVKLAVYFHDLVYDTKAKDNEEQSAQYAHGYLLGLGVPEDIASRVSVLVRATKHHETDETDTDLAIFLDADLAILGSKNEDYDEYASKIRREYSWVPDDQYCRGRKSVLQGFLDRPKIYHTEQVSKDIEQQARANIEREMASLS